MKASQQSIQQKDIEITRLAWDCEEIAREADTPVYSFWPPLPGDAAVAAAVGARFTRVLKHPVVIWRNTTEES